MSAVERLEIPRAAKPTLPQPDPVLPEPSLADTVVEPPGTHPAEPKLRPLLALAPYVARYRGRALLALVSLTVAAVTTLVVPVAARRMIDFGFSPEGIAMINNYFSVMIAVVVVLALRQRGPLLPRHDHRRAHRRRSAPRRVRSISPRCRRRSSIPSRSGELVSRLTADTTQIKSAVGASVSIALRNLVLFVGAAAMMVVTSPKLSGFVLAAIPLIVIPLVAFGRWVRRLSRNAQDTLARSLGLCRRTGRLDPYGAGLYQRAAGERALRQARSSRPMTPRAALTRARAVLTAIIIFIVFSSVVGILWVGSHDVLTGTDHAGPARPVHALCGLRGGRPRPAQRSLGRDFGGLGRGGTAVRNPATSSPPIVAPRIAARAAAARARRRRFDNVSLCLSDAGRTSCRVDWRVAVR